MTAAVCTLANEFPKEQSQGKPGNNTENTPQKLIKSKKSKPKASKQTVKKVERKEKKVKPKNASKAMPARSKSNKTGRSKKNKKLSPRARKEDSGSRPVEKKKSSGKSRSKGKRRAKNQPRRIPLVLPFSKKTPRVGIAHGPVKYTLKRAESNREHRQRVLSNRRKCRRRARMTKSKAHREEPTIGYKDFAEFQANFWTEPEVKVDDLSSLDCGSYGGDVKEVGEEVEWADEKPSTEFKLEDLDSLTTPADFVFNPSAVEFIPKEINSKKSSNTITLSEVFESVKGHQLPKMPIPSYIA